jgi:hypothetical protein
VFTPDAKVGAEENKREKIAQKGKAKKNPS